MIAWVAVREIDLVDPHCDVRGQGSFSQRYPTMCPCDPLSERHLELETATVDEQANFPNRNGREPAVRAAIDHSAQPDGKSVVLKRVPQPYVRVEQEPAQRAASYSSSELIGPTMSPRMRPVPFIAPYVL